MHLAPVLLHGELKLDRAHRGAGTAFEAVARATTPTTMLCWTGVVGCLKERGGGDREPRLRWDLGGGGRGRSRAERLQRSRGLLGGPLVLYYSR